MAIVGYRCCHLIHFSWYAKARKSVHELIAPRDRQDDTEKERRGDAPRSRWHDLLAEWFAFQWGGYHSIYFCNYAIFKLGLLAGVDECELYEKLLSPANESKTLHQLECIARKCSRKIQHSHNVFHCENCCRARHIKIFIKISTHARTHTHT